MTCLSRCGSWAQVLYALRHMPEYRTVLAGLNGVVMTYAPEQKQLRHFLAGNPIARGSFRSSDDELGSFSDARHGDRDRIDLRERWLTVLRPVKYRVLLDKLSQCLQMPTGVDLVEQTTSHAQAQALKEGEDKAGKAPGAAVLAAVGQQGVEDKQIKHAMKQVVAGISETGARGAAGEGAESSAHQPVRILLVDDHPVNQKVPRLRAVLHPTPNTSDQKVFRLRTCFCVYACPTRPYTLHPAHDQVCLFLVAAPRRWRCGFCRRFWALRMSR